METTLIDNPFADYGGIVYGERFIGREDELLRIRQRVFPSNGYGNLAIMGLPRIGKSSLAWQAIMVKEKELIEQKTIPIWITTSDFNSTIDLLQSFAKRLYRQLRQSTLPNPSMDFIREENEKIQNATTVSQLKDPLVELLVELKGHKYKVILILDEFDAAQKFMTSDDFSFLRTLSYVPDRKICIVTTSRKTIEAIEAMDGGVSNFHGIFKNLRLGVYDENSWISYWDWVLKLFQPATPLKYYKQEAEQKVGRHPFLLDVFNSYNYEAQALKKDLHSQLEIDLNDLFTDMEGTLSKEIIKESKGEMTLLDIAMQLVIGPVTIATPEGDPTLRLKHYEFLRTTKPENKEALIGFTTGPTMADGSVYICFSDYFTKRFVFRHIFDAPYWPEWTLTEKKLREIVKIYVQQTFGDDWEQKIRARFEPHIFGWKAAFEKMISWRTNSLYHFPSSSKHLVDYTAPSTIFDVFVSPAWNEWFYDIFQGQKQDWQKKFDHLANVRNPVAHNSAEFVSQEELTLASRYCKEILNVIDKWEKKQKK